MRVAAALGLPFIDTGAMYRAITWLALRRGVPLDQPEALAALAGAAPVAVAPPPPGSREPATIFIDGHDATTHLREPEVERSVSIVSAVPAVRRVMVELQRRVAGRAIVMAGRDIGTVVLPDADLKIYLDASADVRAHRRLLDVAGQPETLTVESIREALIRRDALDSSRAVAPLRPADDAEVINTDAMTLDEVVGRIIALARATQGTT